MAAESANLDVDPPSALPRGTRLGEFELLRVLGVGGFSIVYLAFDHALEREVAVKEYMPASLVGRTETRHVTLRSQNDADTFALGLKSFVNEARMLARFDHPSLLKVHRFWEDNGTAYMAMPVIRGRTLKQARALMLSAPEEVWVVALLRPLLDTLDLLHREGIYHRDIAPDNIVIEADGRPMLLDFGAARRVISDKSQALTAILKPAYAPIEQYGEAGSVKQGPWTDLYALGATVHYLLLGRPPAPATARMLHDEQAPLRQSRLVGCSDGFLNAIDWMLAPRPTDRPQNVAALRAALDGQHPAPERPLVPDVATNAWETTQTYAPGRGNNVDATAPGTMAPTEMGTVRVARPQTPVAAPAPAMPDVLLGDAFGEPGPAPSTGPLPQPEFTVVQPRAAAVPTPAVKKAALWPAMVGGAAVLVAVGAWLGSRPATAPALQGAAGVASAPVAVLPAAPSGASAAALAGSAALPAAALPAAAVAGVQQASAVPTVAETAKPGGKTVVPVAAAAGKDRGVGAPAAPPAKSETLGLRSGPETKPANSASTRPAEVKADNKTAAPDSKATEAARPVPATATATDAPKPAAAPAFVLEVAPPQAVQRVIGPNEACGGRVLLALWLCIERQCAKPEMKNHPECTKWRSDQEQKANAGR